MIENSIIVTVACIESIENFESDIQILDFLNTLPTNI